MRVALVCPYSLSLPGGVQRQVRDLAAALTRVGQEVLVVAPWDGAPGGGAPWDGAPGGGAPWDGAPGDRAPWDGERGGPALAGGVAFAAAGRSLRVPVNGSQAPVALDPRVAPRVTHLLRSWRPDVVHVHEPFVPMVGTAALLSGAAPVVCTFHRSGSSAPYRAIGPLARLALRRADDLVAVSEAARATLGAVVGAAAAERCAIVPNGVDVRRFAEAAAALRPTECGGPAVGEGSAEGGGVAAGEMPTVVFLGRHEERKGLRVLLEAVAGLDRPLVVWVIGEGPETAELRTRFAGDARLVWCGRAGDDEVAARLAGADVYVTPSLGGESFGVVLLEAMAAGTAVIASDIAGYRLAAGGAAVLVPPGEPAALAGALAALLDDPERRAELSAAGRARAAACAIDGVAAAYLQRYERVVRAGNGRAATS